MYRVCFRDFDNNKIIRWEKETETDTMSVSDFFISLAFDSL